VCALRCGVCVFDACHCCLLKGQNCLLDSKTRVRRTSGTDSEQCFCLVACDSFKTSPIVDASRMCRGSRCRNAKAVGIGTPTFQCGSKSEVG
jgi:hypothetical protein